MDGDLTGERGLFDAVRYEGRMVIIDDDRAPGDPEERAAETRGRVASLYGPDRLHRHVVWVLGAYGKRKGYHSLQVDESDEAFRNACEVLHRRVLAHVPDQVLEYLSDQAIEDIVVVSLGFGPVVTDYVQEKRAKGRRAHVTTPINPNEGGIDNE
ncbi:MAG: hypothetical protein ACPGO3_13255 [Magnetospiraceae bacterium]